MSDDPVELTELSRSLLSRAREGDPSPEALEALRRALAAELGGSQGGGGGSSALGGRSRRAAPRARSVGIALGGAMVVALATMLALRSLGSSRPAERVPIPASAPAASQRAALSWEDRGEEPDQPAMIGSERPEAPLESSASAASDGERRTLDEAAYLEAIRRSLVSSPARALRLARRHDTLFPHGFLAEEAEVLEIEAMARLGTSQEARARAERFFERYPESPYRRRLDRATAP